MLDYCKKNLNKNKCGDFGFQNNQRSRIQKWQETYITHNGLKEFPKIIIDDSF